MPGLHWVNTIRRMLPTLLHSISRIPPTRSASRLTILIATDSGRCALEELRYSTRPMQVATNYAESVSDGTVQLHDNRHQ